MTLTTTLRAIGNALEVKRMIRGVTNVDPNDILHRVGLERRRTTADVVLPALGFIAVGAAIGAGLAVLFTPTTGAQVRGRIAKAATDAKDKVEGMLGAGEEEEEEEEQPVARTHNGRRGHSAPAA